MFSKKATKIDEIFTVNLTLCSKGQIDGEDFFNFRGLLRKYELYLGTGNLVCKISAASVTGASKSCVKFAYSGNSW